MLYTEEILNAGEHGVEFSEEAEERVSKILLALSIHNLVKP